MTLTGFPCDIIYNNKISPRDLWELLIEAIKNDQMAVATINSSMMGLNKKIKTQGLPNHITCCIIGAIEIETSYRTTVKLIQIQKHFISQEKCNWLTIWDQNSKRWV